ncbi:MAG: hypothetical protein ACRD0W_19665 [Acidimicrobiales bacterium]
MSPSRTSADASLISAWQQGDRAVFLFGYDRRGVSIWTDLVTGRRSCVGVEIQPMCDAWRKATAQRAKKWMQEKVETPDVVHGDPLPITRVWLQGVPLGTMMTEAAREHAETEAAPVGPSIGSVPVPGAVMSPEDRTRLEDRAKRFARTYDAVAYVARVREGSTTPARDLAALSDYSEAIARARIAEARSLGLLTNAGAGVTGDELTDEAVSVLRQVYHIWPTTWLRTMARAAGLELDPEED